MGVADTIRCGQELLRQRRLGGSEVAVVFVTMGGPLAYEREHHGDPYMTLLRAKGMQRVALQFWHVGAARTKADRVAQAEARRRLLQKLFPSDSSVFDSDG